MQFQLMKGQDLAMFLWVMFPCFAQSSHWIVAVPFLHQSSYLDARLNNQRHQVNAEYLGEVFEHTWEMVG